MRILNVFFILFFVFCFSHMVYASVDPIVESIENEKIRTAVEDDTLSFEKAKYYQQLGEW